MRYLPFNRNSKTYLYEIDKKRIIDGPFDSIKVAGVIDEIYPTLVVTKRLDSGKFISGILSSFYSEEYLIYDWFDEVEVYDGQPIFKVKRGNLYGIQIFTKELSRKTNLEYDTVVGFTIRGRRQLLVVQKGDLSGIYDPITDEFVLNLSSVNITVSEGVHLCDSIVSVEDNTGMRIYDCEDAQYISDYHDNIIKCDIENFNHYYQITSNGNVHYVSKWEELQAGFQHENEVIGIYNRVAIIKYSDSEYYYYDILKRMTLGSRTFNECFRFFGKYAVARSGIDFYFVYRTKIYKASTIKFAKDQTYVTTKVDKNIILYTEKFKSNESSRYDNYIFSAVGPEGLICSIEHTNRYWGSWVYVEDGNIKIKDGNKYGRPLLSKTYSLQGVKTEMCIVPSLNSFTANKYFKNFSFRGEACYNKGRLVFEFPTEDYEITTIGCFAFIIGVMDVDPEYGCVYDKLGYIDTNSNVYWSHEYSTPNEEEELTKWNFTKIFGPSTNISAISIKECSNANWPSLEDIREYNAIMKQEDRLDFFNQSREVHKSLDEQITFEDVGSVEVEKHTGVTDWRARLSKITNINEGERDDLERYLNIYEEKKLAEHWEINKYISENGMWDEFTYIRALNNHGYDGVVKGILPKFFAISCSLLGIGPDDGAKLLSSKKY